MAYLTHRADAHPYSEAPKGRCNPKDKTKIAKPVASPADIHDLSNLIMAAQMALTTPNAQQYDRCLLSINSRINKLMLR